MVANTRIEWAHHTFNPWIGCTKVGPGCDNCYAEAIDHRFGGGHWGPGAERKRTSASNWKQPLKWNRKAEREGTRYRVFCASLADVFDNEVPTDWREDLWELIAQTPHLDWLLLTKRIGNVGQMRPELGLPANVWLGITVTGQEEADRDIPKLLRTPAAVRWLSCEPLLGHIYLRSWHCLCGRTYSESELPAGMICHGCGLSEGLLFDRFPIDWVVVGGESGPNARPMHPEWARAIRDQCQKAGVPFLFKQWGEWVPLNRDDAEEFGGLDTRYGEFHGGQDFVECCLCTAGDRPTLYRLGKKAAGRSLDGRAWDQFPEDLPL